MRYFEKRRCSFEYEESYSYKQGNRHSMNTDDLLYLSGKRTNLQGVWRVTSIRDSSVELRNRYIPEYSVILDIAEVEHDLLASELPIFTVTDLFIFCNAKGFIILDKVQEYFNALFLDLLPTGSSYSTLTVKENKIRDMEDLEVESFLTWFYTLYVKES